MNPSTGRGLAGTISLAARRALDLLATGGRAGVDAEELRRTLGPRWTMTVDALVGRGFVRRSGARPSASYALTEAGAAALAAL